MLPLTDPDVPNSSKRPSKDIQDLSEPSVKAFSRALCPIIAPLATGRAN